MNNILILKIGSIGDIVMALPMVPQIRAQHPGAKITWVCGSIVSELIIASRLVDEVVIVDERKLLTGTFSRKICEMLRIWHLVHGQYDLVINGHPDPRYRLILLRVKAGLYRSFNNRPQNRLCPIPGRHHSDEYARLVTNIVGANPFCYLLPKIVFPLEVDFPPKLYRTTKTIALAPGGARNVLRDDAVRRWPLERYVELATRLMAYGFSVVLTGGVSDMWVRDAFISLPVENLVGKTSIPQLVAVYQNCDLVVTHDSGPLHLAELADVPIVALFGPTPPSSFGPRNIGSTVLWGGASLYCRPCYDGRCYDACSENVCMKEITVEQVLNHIIEKTKG